MTRKVKLSDEERIAAVQEYLDGKGSFRSLAMKYGVSYTCIKEWVERAKAQGIESVLISRKSKKYSKELKIMIVEDYLNGKGSQYKLCAQYGVSGRHLLRKWISWYNSGKGFKERLSSERGNTMKKAKKTTQEERAEIVSFCIQNHRDYGLTMEKYNVTYNQIYYWVRKYENFGIDGLIDRRGKKKSKDDLTAADKLSIENKLLKIKVQDQEMEIKLLKKLKKLKGVGR